MLYYFTKEIYFIKWQSTGYDKSIKTETTKQKETILSNKDKLLKYIKQTNLKTKKNSN